MLASEATNGAEQGLAVAHHQSAPAHTAGHDQHAQNRRRRTQQSTPGRDDRGQGQTRRGHETERYGALGQAEQSQCSVPRGQDEQGEDESDEHAGGVRTSFVTYQLSFSKSWFRNGSRIKHTRTVKLGGAMAGVDLEVPSAPVHNKPDWPASDEDAPYGLDLSRVIAIIPAFNEERNVGS